MDNRALGKGLSALIPEKILEENKDSVSYVALNLIDDNSLQPRQNYDESKINELKESIKEKGILQPIIVRKKAGGYEVVAGERRLRAARALNLTEIPVIVKNVSDQESLVLALVENIQREELNAIEEAQAFKKLIDSFGLSQEDIAKSLGKDRSTVSNLLRLLRLPFEIQKGIINGVVSMGHARALISIEDASKQKEFYSKIIQKGLSVREVENLTKNYLTPRSKKVKFVSSSVHEIAALEEDLQKFLGTKVRISAKRKRGKIIIEYYSLDDLERVLKIIKKQTAEQA
jgi:ParB family transcriptional regulator, chromosome partitioning protein